MPTVLSSFNNLNISQIGSVEAFIKWIKEVKMLKWEYHIQGGSHVTLLAFRRSKDCLVGKKDLCTVYWGVI